jgi:hypothetical protein
LVDAELRSVSDAGAEPDVVVEVTDAETSPAGSTVGSATVSGGRVALAYPRAGFVVDLEEPGEGPVSVHVRIGSKPVPFRLPRVAYRFVEPTYLTPLQVQGYLFVREVMEAIVALYGSAVPLHASAVARDGRALVLSSGGGVGKTSTAMALLGDGGWSPLADDIAFVEPGLVHPNPRRAMVYHYNLSDRALRQRFLACLSTSSRLHFQLEERVSPQRARRRVDAGDLWGTPAPTLDAKLSMAAALVRTEHPTRVRSIEPAEMAERAVAITANEFASLFGRLNEAQAAGFCPGLVRRTLDRHATVLRSTFASADECVEVGIGPDSSPATIAALLKDRFDGSA